MTDNEIDTLHAELADLDEQRTELRSRIDAAEQARAEEMRAYAQTHYPTISGDEWRDLSRRVDAALAEPQTTTRRIIAHLAKRIRDDLDREMRRRIEALKITWPKTEPSLEIIPMRDAEVMGRPLYCRWGK